MAQSRIRESKIPELLLRQGEIGPAQAIEALQSGLLKGIDLAGTLSARKQEKQAKELQIQEIQQKIAQAKALKKAQQSLAGEVAKGPITRENAPMKQVQMPGFPGVSEAGPKPVGYTDEQLPGLEAQRQQKILGLAAEVAPQKFAEKLIEQSYPKGDTADLKTAINPVTGKLEHAYISPSGPQFTGVEAPGLTPSQRDKLLATQEERSKAYTNRWIQPASERMGKDLNEGQWNTNDPGGISAKRALFAASGLNLIEQTKNQPGGADPRQMTELALETARVLIGNGVVAEKIVHDLVPQTAMKEFKTWQEWLRNDPVGLEQQKFVARFEETLKRQFDFHSKEIEGIKRQAISKYSRLEKEAPEQFYSNLADAGYDTAAYRKNKKLIKIRNPRVLTAGDFLGAIPDFMQSETPLSDLAQPEGLLASPSGVMYSIED